MGSANFLYDHFPVQHALAEVMQLNRKVLRLEKDFGQTNGSSQSSVKRKLGETIL